MPYIELHAASAFSFLDGASLPEALVERAADLGYPALALLDRDGVYGVPRFHLAARRAGIKAIIGAELTLRTGVRDSGSGLATLRAAAFGFRAPSPKSRIPADPASRPCRIQRGLPQPVAGWSRA